MATYKLRDWEPGKAADTVLMTGNRRWKLEDAVFEAIKDDLPPEAFLVKVSVQVEVSSNRKPGEPAPFNMIDMTVRTYDLKKKDLGPVVAATSEFITTPPKAGDSVNTPNKPWVPTSDPKCCVWCSRLATTVVVQLPACEDHYKEYSDRRAAGQPWSLIQADFERRQMEKRRVYDSGFKEGDVVRYIGCANHKYNTHVKIEVGDVGIVQEKPNVDFPDDAVQVRMNSGGEGAIDAAALKNLEHD